MPAGPSPAVPALMLAALALAGCERPAPPPASPSPEPPLAMSSAPIAEPPASAAAPPPAGPLDPLFTPGNSFTFAVIEGWHSAVDEPRTRVETITAVKQHPGDLTIATIEVKEGGTKSIRYRVRQGERVLRLEGDGPAPASVADVTAWVKTSGAVVEADGPRAPASLQCAPAGCFATRAPSASGDVWAALLPGAGVLASSSSSYSAETGDGRGHHAFLSGFKLASRGPSTLSLEPEPPDAASVRQRLHEAAAAGRVDDVAQRAINSLRFSLHPEHASVTTALESWRVDDGAAMSALARATAQPCKLVTDDGLRFLACPATFADSLARTATMTELAPTPASARAVLMPVSGGYKLAALLLGGVDDFYAVPEWSSDPPLPRSQHGKFEKWFEERKKKGGPGKPAAGRKKKR
jgi:hypothetical protein